MDLEFPMMQWPVKHIKLFGKNDIAKSVSSSKN